MIEHEIRELKRCPVCHVVALGVVVEEGKPTRYHHETTTHFDRLAELTVSPGGR